MLVTHVYTLKYCIHKAAGFNQPVTYCQQQNFTLYLVCEIVLRELKRMHGKGNTEKC